MFRPERHVDVIIVCDARPTDPDPNRSKDVLDAFAVWAAEHRTPNVPPSLLADGPESLRATAGTRACTVFEDPSNPDAPIVIYVPLRAGEKPEKEKTAAAAAAAAAAASADAAGDDAALDIGPDTDTHPWFDPRTASWADYTAFSYAPRRSRQLRALARTCMREASGTIRNVVSRVFDRQLRKRAPPDDL
jgi:hypothetical protein